MDNRETEMIKILAIIIKFRKLVSVYDVNLKFIQIIINRLIILAAKELQFALYLYSQNLKTLKKKWIKKFY